MENKKDSKQKLTTPKKEALDDCKEKKYKTITIKKVSGYLLYSKNKRKVAAPLKLKQNL